ncbi:hypothetical protein BDY19DRAFT_970210 [Irpex rosettiformis]|uniref:Uncharacterized protein n=1 Tax=Irpex rosettiformis TaxID=378272 RepID=A0ACB8TRM4_9APHY|nr:hypothetical protein BDY19DRAFT_970210 [Irpex rosettiformis]
MGTDARKVVADGYPAQNVFACDLRQEFLDYGHRLYNDASTCGIHFLTANAFDIPYPPPSDGPTVTDLTSTNVTDVSQLRGQVTHLYAGLFFHLFEEAVQYDLALRLGTLMKRESGSVLYGRQMGAEEPRDVEGTGMFAHNPESWTRMWKKAFTELESAEFAENRVVVKAKFVVPEEKNIVKLDVELPVLYWSVQIV